MAPRHLTHDYIEQRSPEELAQYEAAHDPLTDVLNRRGLEIKLHSLIQKEHGNFSLSYIDLDGFKAINDTHGHQEGDNYLVRTAEVIEHSVRTDESPQRNDRPKDAIALARAGGDEFVVALVSVDTPEKLAVVNDRIQKNLKDAGIEASIDGIIHKAGMSLNELKDAADKKMLENKQERKLKNKTPEQLEIARQIGELATMHELDLRDVPSILAALKERDQAA